MTFAGRGLSVSSGLLSEWARILPVLALLLFCTHSWATCVSGNFSAGSFFQCSYDYSDCKGTLVYCNDDGTPIDCEGTKHEGNYFYTGLQPAPDGYCNANAARSCLGKWGYSCRRATCKATTRCTTQAEADSAYCALNPTAEGCKQEDVPPSCLADYQQCVGLGGVWRKVASTSSECASECDLCNSAAQIKVLNTWNKICCDKHLAPPDSSQGCTPPVNSSGGGMVSSVFQSEDGLIGCGSLTTSDGEIIQENAALYKRFCMDHDEYEEQVDTNEVEGGSSSSGGEGISSSEDIGHSFGTELEALGGLYGVLDTIRDTLTKRLTPATEDIRDCLYNFKLCTALEPLQIDWTGMPQDSSYLYIDTAVLKYIKPLMDSSVKLDSAQLKALRSLDTNMLKQMQLDTLKLKNDSATRRVLASGFDGLLENDTSTRRAVNRVDSSVDEVGNKIVSLDSSVSLHLRGVEDGVDSLIDSMTTYLEKVGQGIGAVGDSVGELRGMLQGYLDGVSPSDTDGDAYFSGYINGEDTLGSGWLGNSSGAGVWGNAILGAEHDSNFGMLDTAGLIVDTTGLDSGMKVPDLDSLQAVLDSSVEADRNSLEDTLEAAFDTLKDEIMLVNFDSLIIEPLGMRVPNTNTCPDQCFTFGVSNEGGTSDMNWLAGVGTVTFPLCENLPGMRFNVFVLLRLIARLLVAITCIYIGIWYIAGKK